MSRKSFIKDICDIFENDSARSPTFMKYCDLGQAVSAQDNQQQQEEPNNKTNRANSLPAVKTQDTGLKKNNRNGSNSNFGTIKDRIGKFNTEATTSKPAISNTTRSLKHNKFGTTKEPNSRTQSLNARRRNKLDLKIYEKGSDFKSNLSSPKSPGKTFANNGNSPKTPSPKTPIKEKKTAGKSSKPSSPTKGAPDKIDSVKNNLKEEVFPVIPPKPRYINKIKPHPMMSSKSRQDLQQKIQIFNNLGNRESKHQNSTSPDYVNVNVGSKSDLKSDRESWNLDVRRNRRSRKKSNSNEEQYDTIVKFNPIKYPKPLLKKVPNTTEDGGYDVITKRNTGTSSEAAAKSNSGAYDVIERPLKQIYDVVQTPQSRYEKSVQSTPKKEQGILEIGDKYLNNDKINNLKYGKNPKLLKDNLNFKAMSKDHSLEDDGYVVVLEDKGDENCSDSSSDDDLATEYDVIENLNVTKITVERRYKVPNNERQNSTFNVTRETYYDHNLNPRIERISRQVHKKQDNVYDQVYASKSSLIIQELLQTELVYFKGLLKVYEEYILYFKESANSCGPNINKVFGNFEDIYRQQIEFYGELTECNHSADAIAETFLRNKDLFGLYEMYILNKPVSTKFSTGECLEAITARDKELGNTLNLESFLLTPFQRLIRYRMLLKTLQEALLQEGKPCSTLDEAAEYLEQLIESTNLQVKIMQSIRNSPIDLSCKGKLLMVDQCFLKHNGKKYCSTVILFEDIIIFTRKESNIYYYKGSINLSDLYIRSITEELTSFQLQNFTEYKRKHDNKYVFDLEVSCAKDKQEWVKKLESLLWHQFAAHKRP